MVPLSVTSLSALAAAFSALAGAAAAGSFFFSSAARAADTEAIANSETNAADRMVLIGCPPSEPGSGWSERYIQVPPERQAGRWDLGGGDRGSFAFAFAFAFGFASRRSCRSL